MFWRIRTPQHAGMAPRRQPEFCLSNKRTLNQEKLTDGGVGDFPSIDTCLLTILRSMCVVTFILRLRAVTARSKAPDVRSM